MKGKIDVMKEELKNNLDDLMKIIEIGKKYEINGNNYNLTITPINNQEFKSTSVDFSLCEEILRKEYNLSSDEMLTILQIEIDKMNERALTNQIEYAIYSELKQKLNLSFCNNVEIKIIYDIKNQSLLNKAMISHYSSLGIDIFDKKDSFFNDLCYPFSISNSDIILKDRVLDIYQNYSLCDNGCEYEKINIENMTIICSCKVKKEINTEVAELEFGEIIQKTFKDSNFGVIRCYNLVFRLKNKIHNYGFLICLLFIIIHLICFGYYFIKGTKTILIFVFKEMQKYHYTTSNFNPRKKMNLKIYHKMEDNSNIINDNNSEFLTNNKHKELKSKNSNIFQEKGIDKYSNKNLINIPEIKKKSEIKNNQLLFIFNYKYNKNYFNSSKNTFNKSKKIKKKKKIRNKNIDLNKEKKFPGYYNLIQIDANNYLNNKPPESKYILDNYNYEEAIKYETRDFWRIYFICLLSKENILNTFFLKLL